MATTTTNYGLLKPAATDSYNHLVYDNPNMDSIDAAMKANSDAAITSATCIKSGTTHTIVRSNTDAPVFRFTATGDWNAGDTMVVDGVTVSPYQVDGTALLDGAYVINTEVIAIISGSRVTVLSNKVDGNGVLIAPGVSIVDGLEDAFASIAPYEPTSTALYTHHTGTCFIYNNKRYVATSGINIGDTITPGVNCTEKTVEESLHHTLWASYTKSALVTSGSYPMYMPFTVMIKSGNYKDFKFIPTYSALNCSMQFNVGTVKAIYINQAGAFDMSSLTDGDIVEIYA